MSAVKPAANQLSRIPKVDDIEQGGVELRQKANPAQEPHRRNVAQLIVDYPDSNITLENVTVSKGLTAQIAAEFLVQQGRNELTKAERESTVLLFFRQFTDPFMVLLGLAGLLSLISFLVDTSIMLNLYLALVLFVVVILTCVMSFWQELQANKVVEGFKNLLPEQSLVIRDGAELTIPSAELVVGDVVPIKAGNKCPADLRILLSSSLKIDLSSLTGETEPIPIGSAPASLEQSEKEGRNVAFSGSLILQGSAFGLVIRTGDRTTIGTIASLTNSTQTTPSQMEMDVRKFVKFIAILAIAMATTILVIGSIKRKGHNILDLFINGFLVIIVANVPQGLPATVTSLLTITARRLATYNVFVKRLKVIENLGCTNTICTDKTGTLTKNEMTVVDVWTAQKLVSSNFMKYFTPNLATPSSPMIGSASMAMINFHVIACLCNAARMQITRDPNDPDEDNERAVFTGNPADVALLTWAHPLRSVKEIRDSYEIVMEVPFDSSTKFQMVVARRKLEKPTEQGQPFYVFIKGAPEMLIKRCSNILEPGPAQAAGSVSEVGFRQGVPLDEISLGMFEDCVGDLASKGKRLIGFCQQRIFAPSKTQFVSESEYKNDTNLAANPDVRPVPMQAFCFVGIAALMDPPRDGVAEAVSKCKTAGIRVYMVTGDHQITAQAIAKQVGIFQSDKPTQSPTPARHQGRHTVVASVSGPRKRSHSEIEIDHNTVLLGERLETLTEIEWDQILSQKALVFARTTPQHKLLIVENCQKRGHIVAMTGDGVNDAPALKKSDVGVAMGIAGSQVAKEAADVILMDDSFATIVYAVEQGRLIFDNLIKTIAYTLAHLLPEVIPVIFPLIFGIPPGLSSLQILSIDLGTEIFPAISLAYEKAELSIMERPPRNTKKDKLVSKPLLIYSYLIAGSIISAGSILSYAQVYKEEGLNLSDISFTSSKYWQITDNDEFCLRGKCFSNDDQIEIMNRARSAFYICMVGSQAFHIWACKARFVPMMEHHVWDNAVTNLGVMFEICLVIIFCYVPGVQSIMQTASIGGRAWLYPVGVGVMLLAYNEFRKKWFSHNKWLRW